MTVRRPNIALAAVLLCAFAVNLDVTMVNVVLPTLVRHLHASTSQLQWIVDAYTLVFASLVMAGGSLSDRFGRRRLLILGLVVYGIGNGLAGAVSSSGALTAARAVSGLGAAMIFPTTLSLITAIFSERGARARAIGLWGAVTGIAVALGPIAGGALVENSTWQATFLVKVPLALVAIVAALLVIPNERETHRRPFDVPGVLLATAAIACVTYAIIEAPTAGWGSVQTVGLLIGGLSLLGGFVAYEARTENPMLDVRLFTNLRFSGASLSITFAWFAIAGFIFLIVQYFQFIRGWSPLETGLRTLPVALSIAVGSTVGVPLAVARGTKVVVATGLALLGVAFVWISGNDATTTYGAIAGQMVLLGIGMGFTTAPATESLMGAVGLDQAGVGSAINDTTRELGSTLGVAVMGSVFASLFTGAFSGPAARIVPPGVLHQAHTSVGAALTSAGTLAAHGATVAAATVHSLTTSGFFAGFHAACLVAAGVCLAGCAVSVRAVPAQPPAEAGLREESVAAAMAAA